VMGDAMVLVAIGRAQQRPMLVAMRISAVLPFLILAFLFPRITFGQEPVQPANTIERHVPADAVLAISTDDVAASAKQFQATPLGEMLRSQPWKPYFS